MGIATGQSVGAIAQHHIEPPFRGPITEAVEGWAIQFRATDGLILEVQVGFQLVTPLLGEGLQRGDLAFDGGLLLLLGRGNPCIQCCPLCHFCTS